MKNRVFFLNDTSKIPPIDAADGTLVVWHQMYNAPAVPGAEYIEWEKYKIGYSSFEPKLIILVGLNRMITPSNRCDYVHEYLTTMTPNVPKISIDTAPFVGEPWRLFFHYLYAGVNGFGVNYSYPIEREWQSWFYRETNDCRLSGDNVRFFIKNTYSELQRLTTRFKLTDVSEEELNWYSEAKLHVFSKYDTPKLLVNNLLKLSNDHFGTALSFDSWKTNQEHELPRLGVFQFVVEENVRRMMIFNAFCHENILR